MKYDVIVVGGGPAGAVAARKCAEAGLETVILEKEYFPRPKPCAGGVSVAATNLLDDPVPPEVVEARCTSLRGFYGDMFLELEMDREFLVVVSREVFDLWLVSLAQAAGAELRQGEKVTSIEVDEKGVTVRTPNAAYAGRLVIGADGVNSTVAKAVRKPLQRKELAFCVCSDIAGGDLEFGWREGIEVHYGPLPMSYRWVFPKRGRLSVGFGGWLTCVSNIPEMFRSFLREKGFCPEQRLSGQHIPLGGIPRPTVGDRVILAGDAAGYADPFTGEGIRYAIASGRQAAAVAAALIHRGLPLNRQNLLAYERSCHEQFGSELKTALLIARLFRYFPRAFFGLLFSCREPFQKTLETLQGRIGYRQLYLWLLRQTPGLLCRHFSPETATRA
ncbi:MAG: geranylgeranyl reductase family protein [Peptococcaceae bacterium]|nr:geranylgeranyl reductase family protein [Peptococcaceae bacterium]